VEKQRGHFLRGDLLGLVRQNHEIWCVKAYRNW
jgi:hypothetical protein